MAGLPFLLLLADAIDDPETGFESALGAAPGGLVRLAEMLAPF
jgi:hypothetical protein